MALHVHRLEVVHEAGLLELPAHVEPAVSWSYDGQTAYPNEPCMALVVVGLHGRECRKLAIVELLVDLATDKYPTYLRLCGSHFTRHRGGRRLLVRL